jgi:nitrous oxidase accessory protein NosD
MRTVFAAVGAVASLLAFGATSAQASSGATTTYVSPSGHASGHGTSCHTARYSDINAAVAATGPGRTVVICPGLYRTQVVITKPLSLVGRPGAVIDAHGQKPLKVGTMTLPGSIGVGVLATSHVTVRGLTVQNAGFDAILIALSSGVTASHNRLTGNGNVGVDINGSSWSQVIGNVSEHNTGG